MVVLSLSNTAAAQQANLPPARAAIWNEVKALNDSMVAAFNRGDKLAVARFYADNARMAGGGGPETAGRAAIDRYWTRGQGPGSWRLEVLDVGGSANLAYQVGRSHLTSGTGATARTYVTNFVVVWERQAGGGLRITYDLYN